MSIETTQYVFTMQNIQHYAPETSGVYALYNAQGHLIYYGKSDVSIRGRLIDHFSGKEGKCTQGAHYFNFIVTKDASSVEKQLLEEYLRMQKKLPSCNEKVR